MLIALRSRRMFLSFVTAACLTLFVTPTFPACNSLTKINHDQLTSSSSINITVGIDWDVNANPPVKVALKEGSDTLLNKDYLKSVFEAAADSIYTMTEGKHRIGTVYVYNRKQSISYTDISFLNRAGRASASVSGIHEVGDSVTIFTVDNSNTSESEETPVALGKTIGHEFGHYIYGLYDEYREAGGKSKAPSDPQDEDTPRNTIMNDLYKYPTFSTSSDYLKEDERKTAHYRMYEKSAWDLLVANPDTDREGSRIPNLRKWHEAFRKFTAPTAATLTKPINSTNSRSNLKIVYMESNPRIILAINLNLASGNLKEVVTAAVKAVDQANSGTEIAIVTYDGTSAKIARNAATIGSGTPDPERQAIKTFLLGLKPSETDGSKGIDEALKLAASLGSPVAAAKLAYKSLNKVLPLSVELEAAESLSRTPGILLLTDEATRVGSETITLLKESLVPVYPVTLRNSAVGKRTAKGVFSSAADGNLNELATTTSGSYSLASSGAELTSSAQQVMNRSEGDRVQILNQGDAAALAGGASSNLSTPVAGSDLEDDTLFVAFWEPTDAEKMSYSVRAPDGTAITPANAEALGIEYGREDSEGYAFYAIPKDFQNKAGTWISTVTASAAAGAFAQFVASDSDLAVNVGLHGGTRSDPRPPTVTVAVSNLLVVKGATVTVDLYDSSGTLLKSLIALRDDGKSPDARAFDGIYTASLADYLKVPGQYSVVATVTNPDGSAAFGPILSGQTGVSPFDTPIKSLFKRTQESIYDYEGSQSNVLSDSGGCTIGNGKSSTTDPALVLIIIIAAICLFLRNRTAYNA